MIEPDDHQKLAELQEQVHCTKKFVCVESSLADLCQGKYYRDLDILECMEKIKPSCGFARPFGCTLVCACPLRKFIAKNFDKWSAESTTVLRPVGDDHRQRVAISRGDSTARDPQI